MNGLGSVSSQGTLIPRALARGSGGTWVEVLSFGPGALLLLWACYAHGAFLEPDRTVVAIAAPVLGLGWGVVRWRCHTGSTIEIRPAWGLAEGLLAGFAALGAVSALWSLDWPRSLEEAGILVGAVFFVRLGRAVGGSPTTRSSMLLVLGEVGVLLSLLSIVGYAFRVPWLTQDMGGKILPTGTFGYANALAAFLFLSLAATVALFLEARGSDRRSPLGLLAGAAAVQTAAIALTQSRAAVAVAVLLVLLVMGVRIAGDPRRTGARRWLVIAMAALISVGMVTVAAIYWAELRPHLSSADIFRLKTWEAALDATKQSPLLGHGLGTFYPAYAPFKLGAQTTYAHNLVIQTLVEVGVVGTGVIAAFLAAAVVRPLRILAGPASDPRVPLLLGLQAFVLQNLVDLTWYFPALLLTFALVLGLALSYQGCDTTGPNARGSASG